MISFIIFSTVAISLERFISRYIQYNAAQLIIRNKTTFMISLIIFPMVAISLELFLSTVYT
jgi:hypothetical protein